jgi:aldehyde:ferredoxin oxidoreductase
LPYKEKVVHRPEYETFASFCTMLCIDDLDIGMQASTYLNRAGMDTISAGATIAYILEAIEEGYFKKEDFACKEYPQGFLPQWGDPTYIMPLLRLMVTREGIGDKLADGTYMAALRFPETKGFDMSANGSEMGMHDSRYFKANAQNYIADPTPGRHTAGNYDRGESYGIYSFYPAVKPYINKAQTPFQMGLYSAPVIKMWQVMESLGMCSLVFSFGKYHLEEKIHAATGWDMKVEEFLEIGGRIQTLRQLFNAREGAIRHEMPQRVMGSPPLKRGGNKGTSVDPETIVQGYYRGMGFRQDGVPTEDTLHSYGLEYLVPDLEACTGVPEPLVNEYLADKEGSNGF